MKYGIGKFIDQKPVNYCTLDFTRIVAYCNRLEGKAGKAGNGGWKSDGMRLKNTTLNKKGVKL